MSTHKTEYKSSSDGRLESLSGLSTLLQAKITKDETGEAAILGKSINSIHAGADGRFFILVSLDSAASYNSAKRKLAKFCTLHQDGDCEGCWIMDGLPTAANARTLRAVLGIRKQKVLSDAAKAQSIANLSKTA